MRCPKEKYAGRKITGKDGKTYVSVSTHYGMDNRLYPCHGCVNEGSEEIEQKTYLKNAPEDNRPFKCSEVTCFGVIWKAVPEAQEARP